MFWQGPETSHPSLSRHDVGKAELKASFPQPPAMPVSVLVVHRNAEVFEGQKNVHTLKNTEAHTRARTHTRTGGGHVTFC